MEQRITDEQAKSFVSCEPDKCGYCENRVLCCSSGISTSIRKVAADLLDARSQRDELLAALKSVKNRLDHMFPTINAESHA